MAKNKSKAGKILDKAKALFGEKVEALSGKESKIRELISGVGNKLANLKNNPRIQKLIEPVSVFIRMIKAHFAGTHKLSGTTLGLLLLALVYFLSPFDLIPDFLGIFGFADDLSVILAVYAKVKDEIEQFLDWERTQI
ncbi:YkvA family protein [Algoriphagus algorifonticola]|uniref:YkvA family protein n=1 Tax=Algoriphagus algorifonticola TaxID=2593007 RepID=UPI00119F6E88|nr:YkvA family protein [Algoriphagus algorifonticola]